VNAAFNGKRGLVVVRAEIFGPSGSAVLRLAVDTGATATLINVGHIAAIGYDLSLVTSRVQVTTGSGVEFVPRIKVANLKALGETRSAFPVLSHTLHPAPQLTVSWGWIFSVGAASNWTFAAVASPWNKVGCGESACGGKAESRKQKSENGTTRGNLESEI